MSHGINSNVYVPCDASASMLFLACDLDSFYSTTRKMVFNLRKRVMESMNLLTNNFSKITTGNNISKNWRDILRQ